MLKEAGTHICAYIADLGLDIAKQYIEEKIDEHKLHECLCSYVENQQKYNEMCTLAEEFDFQGLVEYIENNLLSEFSIALFNPNKKERQKARNSLYSSAYTYAKANSDEAKYRVAKILDNCINIIRGFLRGKISKEQWIIADEIVDSVTQDIEEKSKELKSGQSLILKNTDAISEKVSDLSSLVQSTGTFSPNTFFDLSSQEKWAEIEKRSCALDGIITHNHPLYPEYGFEKHGNRYFSVPLTQNALTDHPPRFICRVTATMGNEKLAHIDESMLDYADRHQLKIILSVEDAHKLLGDTPDPYQHEAEELIGQQIIRNPKPFPPAFPCSISVNGEQFYKYVELRTAEILDDGTYIVTNKEQVNCSIKIELKINLQDHSKPITYSMKINPNSSNADYLVFLRMMKTASTGGNIEIYSYKSSQNFLAGSAESFTIETGFADVDEEIDFFDRICQLENFLGHSINVPSKICIDDYNAIIYISELTQGKELTFTWNEMKFKMIVDEKFRQSINEEKDEFKGLFFVGNTTATIFGEELHLEIIRDFKEAKIKDLERFRKKLEYTDDGEEIEITYIAGKNNNCVDKIKPNGLQIPILT